MTAGAVAVLFFLFLLVFAAGAVSMNVFGKYRESGTDPALDKEKNLESADPADLVDDSPRAEELRDRTDAIAESVRKRIRDRSRDVVSGYAGDGTPTRR